MSLISNPPTAVWTSAPSTISSASGSGGIGMSTTGLTPRNKDKITFEVSQECKHNDPGMYYMLVAYLYKHMEEFQTVISKDEEFKKYHVATKITDNNGQFHFTVHYEKDVTQG